MLVFERIEALGEQWSSFNVIFRRKTNSSCCGTDCSQSEFARRDIAEAPASSTLIVFDPPSLDQVQRLGQRVEPMDVDTLAAN